MLPPRVRVVSDVGGTFTDSPALRTAILLASVLVATPAVAGSVNSPECRRDLAMADQLVHSVRLRENSVRPGDFDGLCRLLRRNLQDMSSAREPMNRCLTGRNHGENVAQMDASIGDIRAVLAKHCRR